MFINKSDNWQMKNPNRNTISRLDELPNIGKAIARKLQLIGIAHPKELIGKDSFALYFELCLCLGKKVDPCIIDVFMSAIHFMEKGEPLPWWSFTEERKELIVEHKRRE